MFDFFTSFLRAGLDIPDGELNPLNANFKFRKAVVFWFLVGSTILAGMEFVKIYRMTVEQESLEKQLWLCLTDAIELRVKQKEPLKAPPPAEVSSDNTPGLRPPERPILSNSHFAR